MATYNIYDKTDKIRTKSNRNIAKTEENHQIIFEFGGFDKLISLPHLNMTYLKSILLAICFLLDSIITD